MSSPLFHDVMNRVVEVFGRVLHLLRFRDGVPINLDKVASVARDLLKRELLPLVEELPKIRDVKLVYRRVGEEMTIELFVRGRKVSEDIARVLSHAVEGVEREERKPGEAIPIKIVVSGEVDPRKLVDWVSSELANRLVRLAYLARVGEAREVERGFRRDVEPLVKSFVVALSFLKRVAVSKR